MRAVWMLLDLTVPVVVAVLVSTTPLAHADPAKYPQFAQQALPDDVKPEFISVDALVKEIKNGAKPIILDVRTAEEFKAAHILGAVSAPLDHFRDHIKSIPRDRIAILY
jgi:3-mercaptopyruvate sulfurtransferase SseA